MSESLNPIGVEQLFGGDRFPLVLPSADCRGILADFWLSYDDPAGRFAVPFHVQWMYGFGTQAVGTWQNQVNPLDVDNDGIVTGTDALLVINRINAHGSALPLPSTAPPYYDVDGDGLCTQADINYILNWLNNPSNPIPLTVAQKYHTPVHALDLIVVDANGAVVCDTRQASNFATKNWGTDYQIVEWDLPTAILRLVRYMPNIATIPVQLEPAKAVLDARVIYRMPNRLRSIRVGLEKLTGPRIMLQNGYNTTLTDGGALASTQAVIGNLNLPQTGGRAGESIVLGAEPGSGLGNYPGCNDPNIYIQTINKVPPTPEGDFYLQTDPCYWLERPNTVISTMPRLMTIQPATLKIHNDCQPCCSCDAMIATYEGQRALAAEGVAIGANLEAIRDKYAANRAAWIQQKGCRETNPQQLKLGVACGGYLAIGYSFCNPTAECAGPLYVNIQVRVQNGETNITADTFIVPYSTFKNDITQSFAQYSLTGSWADSIANWNKLNPYMSAQLQFLVKHCNPAPGDSATVTVFPIFAGKSYPAISQTVSLLPDCPRDPCINPDVDA